MKQLRVSHETLIVQVPFISVYTHNNCSAPSFNAFQLEIGGLQHVDKSVAYNHYKNYGYSVSSSKLVLSARGWSVHNRTNQ